MYKNKFNSEKYMPNGYTYLNSNNKTGKPEDSLEYATGKHGLEHRTIGTLIIKDNSTGKYHLFRSQTHFEYNFPGTKVHNCDEIIVGVERQKPKYDLDGFVHGDLEKIVNVIEEYFGNILDADVEIAILNSSGYDTELNKHKNSAHLVITNYAFENHVDANAVTREIAKKIAEEYPTIKSGVFDVNVNKSTQNFRTPLSAKNGRTMRIPIGYTRAQLMITNTDNLPLIKLPYTLRFDVDKKMAARTIIDVNDHEIVAACAPYMAGWDFRKRYGNLFVYDRPPLAAYCKFCNLRHDRDNYLCIIIKGSAVYQKCIRGQAMEKLFDLVGKTPVTPVRKLDKIVEYIPPKQVNTLGFENISRCNNPTVDMFPRVRSLYVRANMKMGKTTSMIEYINQFTRVLILAFRRTFTHELKAKLNRMGFESYEDIDGKIDMELHEKVIVQVESLHRMRFSHMPDLIVLDESESIFEQFMSPTMKQARSCSQAFEYLLKHSTNCLLMDANLSSRSVDLVRKVRSPNDELLIINEYQNMSLDTVHITESKDQLNDTIINKLNNGENVITPTNSKSYADTLDRLVVDSGVLTKDQILLITSDMSEVEKARIFSDVNGEWKKYRLVIFTPTCSAGVSFTEKHFDSLCGYFTSKSSSIESFRQSMYRVRDIATANYYVCFGANGTYNRLETIEEIRRDITRTANITSREHEMFDLVIENGDFAIKDSFLLDIWLQNRLAQNKSKCIPLELFTDQCKATGAKIVVMPNMENALIISNYEKAAMAVKQENYEDIVASPDITWSEFQELAMVANITLEQKYSKWKYMLRKDYNWDDRPIDLAFLNTYAEPGVRRAFKNRREALQSDDINISLENIRRSTVDPDKINSGNRYMKHRIANQFLIRCGFSGILDTNVVPRNELIQNIEECRNDILNDMSMICIVFEDKEKIAGFDIKPFLEFTNGILETTYGLKIAAKSDKRGERDKFVIKHKYNDKFENRPNDNKPYIEINWKYKPIAIHLDLNADDLNVL